jgi:2-polyprenyl-3-methyl-5-hydroxy-6-metoxy-1,4-benzoquinol methylase
MMETDDQVAASAARDLFSRKYAAYDRFINLVRYPQGIRAFFLHAPWLQSHLRVLDAGCGTGVITLGLQDALSRRKLALGTFHAFDLTPAMLARFQATLKNRAHAPVDMRQANVLELEESLPETWSNYDVIVTASMLEYVPRHRISDALRSLGERLSSRGRLVLFITKRNWLTRPLVGSWWRSNLYGEGELRDVFGRAGFSSARFAQFPRSARYLALWGHVIEAQRPG